MKIVFDKINGQAAFFPEQAEYIKGKRSEIVFQGKADRKSIEAMLDSDKPPNSCFTTPFYYCTYDSEDKILQIRQSFFGAPCNLWFAETEHRYFVCDSLIGLRECVKMRFEFNTVRLYDFIYNGFINGSETLIKDVYSIPASKCLIISKSGAALIDDIPKFNDSEFDPETEYHRAFDAAMKNAMDEFDGGYAVTLSSGYDSNSILSYIKRTQPDSKIQAFCIGGERGVNEVDDAKTISEMYSGVSFHSSLVGPHTLNHIDEIVQMLEGSVYERGIFLQYELGKLLKEHGQNKIICGECADQVFHCRLFDCPDDDIFFYNYRENPFEMASNIVFKKNALIMKGMGVYVCYPFLHDSFLALGYHTRHLNGETKEFHKLMCQKDISPEVMNLVSKHGGTTDMKALFATDFDCMKEAQQFMFYSKFFELTPRFPHDEAVYDYYLVLAYLECFHDRYIGQHSTNP